ncbi:MAG TPA: PAAR domain-containing protein [Longimicrobium sp.]|nr:PAAR domain-containing protein [Longimicrobium sp.]
MGKLAAKKGDMVVGVDTHMVLMPLGTAVVVAPQQLPFAGPLTGGVSRTVLIDGQPAATEGSTALNGMPHVPLPPAMGFVQAPGNQGKVVGGSGTVWIEGRAAARDGDEATTCNDPPKERTARVVAAGTVWIG